MTQLSVNINKIALIRNSRGENLPDLLAHARTILETGTKGITVHPRSDARHIRAQDVRDLRKVLDQYPARELNVEGNPFLGANPETEYPGFIELVEETHPEQVTLVPDQPHQLTSDHGWHMSHDYLRLKPVIQRLKQISSLRVSLFISTEASPDDFVLAKEIGADRVELYTDDYVKHYERGTQEKGITPYQEAGKAAVAAGLEVNAGHALSLKNLGYLIEHLPYIKEVSIGHALICEALEEGLVPVVKQYLEILNKSP